MLVVVGLVHLVAVLGSVAGQKPGSRMLGVRWHPRGSSLHGHGAVAAEAHAGRHPRVHMVVNHPPVVHHERAGHGHTAC